jgi:hypothetical protein
VKLRVEKTLYQPKNYCKKINARRREIKTSNGIIVKDLQICLSILQEAPKKNNQKGNNFINNFKFMKREKRTKYFE